MSELRWNRPRREWVVTATHRMERTFLPPRDYCPLCPTQPGGFATEIPWADFEICVFENRFPTFHLQPPEPEICGGLLGPVEPARGVCEVVVYTARHDGSISDLSPDRMRLLTRVWRDRYRDLGARPEVEYVFIFENRGAEVGVTLHHPHGQIYAFPYIPPVPALELESAAQFQAQEQKCMFCALVAEEMADGRRIIAQNDSFAAFIPFAARYPYEVHLYCLEHRPSLLDLEDRELDDLAEILPRLVRGYDRLFNRPFPYIMVLHQEPCKKRDGPAHLHFEFYPPLRSEDKLKYLAGCEQGAGTFINDSLPEEKAAELKACLENVQQGGEPER